MTNFEEGVRIPFIIRAPWIEGSVGRRTDALAEVIDLYVNIALVQSLFVNESVDGSECVTPLSTP